MSRERLRILATAFDYRPRLGGIATLSYGLFRALAARDDIELRVLAPQTPFGPSESAEWDRRMGGETTRVALPVRATRAIPKFALALAREKSKFKPDAILNTLWHPEGVATFLSEASGRVPYFVFAHGLELMEAESTWKKRMRSRFPFVKRSVFNSARGVFVNSEYTRGLVSSECRVPAERVRVAHPGFDPTEFFPLPEKPRDLVEKYGLEGKKVFLTVTRLDDYKGVDRAIAAVSRVREKHPEAVYLVCGDGPDRERLVSIARHYRVGESVRFAGKIDGQKLRDYYNLCDVFVLLSRQDLEAPNVEGFGIVFVEAAACGKPSIAGNSGGVPDAVGGHDALSETGWLVDPNDPEAISRCMIEALENPALVARKGEAARTRAIAGFTWDQMAETIVRGIREGLGGNS